jgi:beta-phosphoglucomutase
MRRKFRARLLERDCVLAIASAAPPQNRDLILRGLGIGHLFSVILGEESGPPKPDPAVLLSAARLLTVEPAACIVFEDSPTGVTAGAAAGMRVVALLTSHNPAELPEATLHIRDFTELEIV